MSYQITYNPYLIIIPKSNVKQQVLDYFYDLTIKSAKQSCTVSDYVFIKSLDREEVANLFLQGMQLQSFNGLKVDGSISDTDCRNVYDIMHQHDDSSFKNLKWEKLTPKDKIKLKVTALGCSTAPSFEEIA